MKNDLLVLILVLLCSTVNVEAARVDTVQVVSKSMNKAIPNLVVVPNTYNHQEAGFPVLYLLHGATGSYEYWLARVPAIKEYADNCNFIIVCPNGGYTSWYFDSPIDETMKYETYISEELVESIDLKYNTIAQRKSRAITGASMGGHGAFYLAFRNPSVWGAAGSMSGGLDIRPFPNNWDIAKRLGSYSENKELWEQNTVTNLVHLIKGKDIKLIFDCGVDDFFYPVNKKMHQKLLEAKILHTYIERPGKHNGKYWAETIKYQLLFFNEFFRLGE